eukprot:SAG31_NODE_38988_length_291_cov_1.619792_1_plen_85_part_10
MESLATEIDTATKLWNQSILQKESIRERIDSNGGEFLDDDEDDQLRTWVGQLRDADSESKNELFKRRQLVQQKSLELEAAEKYLR